MVINKYFRDILGGVSNNLNTIIIYLFLYTGTRFFKGRIFFFITLAFIKPLKVLYGIIISG